MGRPRLWVIRALSRREREARERFIEELRELIDNNHVRARLRADWDLFLALNGLVASVPALELFVADLAMALAPSTAAEYVAKLSSLPCMRVAGLRSCHNLLVRLFNVRAADYEAKKAVSITHRQAITIVRKIPSPLLRAILSIMALMGPRAKDITHLRPSQLDVPTLCLSRRYLKRYYRAQVRIAKNRKSLGKRAILYVPVEWRSPLRAMGNRLSRFLAGFPAKDRNTQIFRNCKTPTLNDALKKACDELKIPRVTTYSFRRLYVSEVIRLCGRNFSRVRQFTLHFSEDTIRAFYDKW